MADWLNSLLEDIGSPWSGSMYSGTPSFDYSSINFIPEEYGSRGYSSPEWGGVGGGYFPAWDQGQGDAASMYMPDFTGMNFMPGETGGIPDWISGMGDWLGSQGDNGGTIGSNLLNKAITGGLGLLLGSQQSKALEKARKKQAQQQAERDANAGKLAAQQRLDYINGLREDPRFREFTVSAPDRTATAANTEGYGQTGGEHLYFDPAFLSKVTTTPVAYKCGGLVGDNSKHYASGGLARIAGGQDDVVDAKLAPGEFVMDAETVSALGDGSTQAGAAKLEKMRRNIRKHKRGGGLSKIAPRSKAIEEYVK